MLSDKCNAPNINRVHILSYKQGFKMPQSHTHSAVEIINVLDGFFYMEINDNCVKVKQYECLIIFPNVVHRFDMKNSKLCRFMIFHFEPDGVTDALSNGLNTDEKLRFLYEIKTNTTSFIKLVNNSIIRNVSERIINEYLNKKSFTEALLNLYICELYIHLSRILNDMHSMFTKPLNSYMSKALDFINSHYFEGISANDVADYCGISLRHLTRLFTESINMTPSQYINILILKKAKELLAVPENDITSIAQALGFNTSQYFSTFFKKHEGITPKNYRKLHAAINTEET